MRAVSYEGPKNLKVRDKPEPRIEDPRDAILRVTRTAICGSDLHLYHGLFPDTRIGSTFGHEFTGTVVETGPEVQNLKAGDRVVVPFAISCGACFFCKRGLWASCELTNPVSDLAAGVFGYSHTTGGYDGGQADYVRVPFADVGPMKIPDDLDEETVLFLSDILPTGWFGAEMGGIREGDTVCVLGCGPVGLFAQKAARLMGAARVIAVDHVEYRLEAARRFADAEVLDFRRTNDVITLLRRLTGGRGPDVVIDAVGLEASGSRMHKLLGKLRIEAGAATALEWAIHAVRRGGTVSVIGVYGPPWNIVPIGVAMNKGLTIRLGQCPAKRYMEPLLGEIRAGRIDPTAIISHRLPLEEAREAYRMFAEKKDECIKCVLIPQA